MATTSAAHDPFSNTRGNTLHQAASFFEAVVVAIFFMWI
jgi:hypothetical protein